MNRFWDFIDSRAVIRRITLFAMLWMTWESFEWAGHFAEVTAKTGIEVAGIIAAVTAPIAALQGYVFKLYVEGRTND